ncbi:MAG: archaeosortase/exosortase family protein [Candidatus Micrarchaeaceae archaeon]
MRHYTKGIGIVVFAIAIVVMLLTSLSITSFSILDTDPTTYVIVPMLMLPLFALFAAKNKLIPRPSAKSTILGVCLFAVFIALAIYLRLAFSILYMSFKVDMLLMPLGFAAIAIILFGFKNLSSFKSILIYTLFASPIFLTPLVGVNQGFARLNTAVVYSIIHAFDSSAAYMPPLSIRAGGYLIGIGTTCAGIGMLIGIVFFLIPVAYFYNGRLSRKVYWIVAAFALLLLLNIARMSAIGYLWIASGPNAAVSFVHNFAGMLLFYADIIVMLVAAPLFGLRMPFTKRTQRRSLSSLATLRLASPSIFAALALSFAYLAITANYSTALNISPMLVYNHAQFNPLASKSLASDLSEIGSGMNFSSFSEVTQNAALVLLSNETFTNQSPIVVLVTKPNPSIISDLLKNTTIFGRMGAMGVNGVPASIYDVESNGTRFFVYSTELAYVVNASAVFADAFVVMPAKNLTGIHCKYDRLYTALLDFPISLYTNRTEADYLESAYCTSSKLVGA